MPALRPGRWLLTLLVVMTLAAPAAAAAQWREVAPGLAYRELSASPSLFGLPWKLHAFRVDLKRWRPRVLDARQQAGRATATVEALAREAGAALAVNASFFDEHARPLGLLVDEGRQLNPLRKADWGVLSFKGHEARLVHTREWEPDAKVTTAVQVGPRMVVAGEALSLKPQTARRAAIGLRADGQLVVVVSGSVPLESNLLARIFRTPEADGGLGCAWALMMDGGPSAQLFAAIGDLRVSVPGGTEVPVALGFLPR